MLAGLLTLVAPLSWGAAPLRVASTNLCADQLLLMLLPRERIASLSYWAVRAESPLAAQAAGLPLNHGLVEEVLPHNPDLILVGRYNDVALVNSLRRVGQAVAIVEVPASLAEAATLITAVGELVASPGRAAALRAEFEARLARILPVPAEQRPLAVIYAPNGVTPGRGTVLDEVVARAGLRNLAAELGIEGYGALSLETVLNAAPDLLIIEGELNETADSLAHRQLQHPALAELAERTPVVGLPARFTQCVGPATVEAIERLAAARARLLAGAAHHSAARSGEVRP